METVRPNPCDGIEPLLTPYVDGEATPADRATVERHLAECVSCDRAARAERTSRELLRARRSPLGRAAPPRLRVRCQPAVARRFALRRWAPLSLAAAVVLAAGAALLYDLSHKTRALAAQLAADHITCFTVTDTSATADPIDCASRWEQAHGWGIRVVPSLPDERLRLVGVRRCLSSEGQMAHVLYTVDGHPLSVFIWRQPDLDHGDVEVLGHRAILWSSRNRMYAVVGTESAAEMARVAQFVRLYAE